MKVEDKQEYLWLETDSTALELHKSVYVFVSNVRHLSKLCLNEACKHYQHKAH